MVEVVQPLTGVTVVAVEHAVAAPLATRQLAELGARVIKVERAGTGDFARGYDNAVCGLSSHFAWLNRSKESITLNLKHPSGMEILHDLISRSDVFVQNLSPRAAKSLGIHAEALREHDQGLIVCSISGYGSGGPYEAKKAYDLLVQAESGLISVTGTEQEPAKAGIAVADIAAGMNAVTGILASLYRRAMTGVGATIDVSLFDSLADWMGYPAYYGAYLGGDPPRTGTQHATIAPYGPLSTCDGKSVFLAVQNQSEWKRLCHALGRPSMARDPKFDSNTGRVQYRKEIVQELERAIREKQLTADGLVDLLDRAQVASGELRQARELFSHPQLVARNRVVQIGSPVGEIMAILSGAVIDDAEPCLAPIPALGEHTMSVLEELARSREELSRLVALGVV